MKVQTMDLKFYKSEKCKREFILDSCERQEIILDDKDNMVGCLNSAVGDYTRMNQMIDALISGEISSFNVSIVLKDKTSDVYTLYANKEIQKQLMKLKAKFAASPQLIIHELLMTKSTRYKSIYEAKKPGMIIMRKYSSYRCVPTVSCPGFTKTVSLEIVNR